MKRLFAALTLFAFVAFGTGASGDHRSRREYLKAYMAETEHVILYWDFGTSLNMRATYLSAPFRARIAEERRRLLHAPEADHQAFLERLLSDDDAYHEVIFSADSGLDAGEKFGTTEDGWQLRLIADGTEEQVVTIFKVKDPNMLQRALYPHFNKWSDLWIARFQKTVKNPEHVELEIYGGYGHGSMNWKLK